MNEKRVSYRQLEKQCRELTKQSINGKDLLMRVTRELTASKDEGRALLAQLKVSYAIIGILVGENGRESVTISKELIQETLATKKITWKENEDKALELNLMEVGKDVETIETRDTSGDTEQEQVQQQEDDSGRNGVCEQERSSEIQSVEVATDGRED